MTKKEAITRLCSLVSEVGERRHKNTVTHDCFCGHNIMSTEPRIDDTIITFIERCVREKLL